MSRSKKHTRIFKFKWLGKFGKKVANRRVRHNEVSSGGNYKKVYDSWNIYEWKMKDFNKEKTGKPYDKLYERK